MKLSKQNMIMDLFQKNDVDAAKLTLDSENADFINKRNQCYLSYLKYIEMKEGY